MRILRRHSKLLVIVCSVAAGGLIAMWPDTTWEPAHTPDAPLHPSERRPNAADFASRVEALLPALERHVAAGSAKSHDTTRACAEDANERLAELDKMEHALADFDRSDAEVRSLATPFDDALSPLRQCVGCGPRGGCADAARALVRLENGLARYHRQSTPSGS